MGIYRQSGRIKGHRTNYVCGLSADPRQGNKIRKRLWNFSRKPVLYLASHTDEALGFRPEEPGCMDQFLNRRWVGPS